MLTILFAYVGEINWVSPNFLVKAFRQLGHNVITCGPHVGNYDGELKSPHDIKVYDREHPESYTYDEILAKCPVKPDLIFQAEPQFYFIGNKPDIPCAYWCIDNHRGPLTQIEMAKKGQFDFVFVCQKYYMKFFQKTGLNCFHLPFACDPDIHKIYPEIEEQCDVVFAGNTGINIFGDRDWMDKMGLPAGFDTFPGTDSGIGGDLSDKGQLARYTSEIPSLVLNGTAHKRFSNWKDVDASREYAERAEHLMRLSKDFNVRLYGSIMGKDYGKLLNRGKIVFNYSLRNDVTLRVFEALACRKLLITDEIPYQEELLEDGLHYRTYGKYYSPDNVNFDLDYGQVKDLAEYYLKHEDERLHIAEEGQKHVLAHHTYIHRAKKVLEVCGLA